MTTDRAKFGTATSGHVENGSMVRQMPPYRVGKAIRDS
jgi:hypothetical protein